MDATKSDDGDTLVPDYAPVPPVKNSAWIHVVQSGLLTTALALVGVWWLGGGPDGGNVMGWYANYVIPVGAILIGAAAGSGYGLASWYAGVRVDGRLLALVAALLLAAYFAAQYVEFRSQGPLFWQDTGEPATFPAWFHANTTAFAWKPDRSSSPPLLPTSLGGSGEPEPTPLGWWGYLFVGLGVAGFVGGGLIAPLALRAILYCDDCGRYMKTRAVGTFAASVPVKKLKKAPPEEVAAHEAEQNAAGEAAGKQVERLMELATADDGEAFRREVAPAVKGKKANGKLPRRVDLSLATCPACGKGTLSAKLATGHDQQLSLVDVALAEVTPEFTTAAVG